MHLIKKFTKNQTNTLIPGVGLNPNYVFEFYDLQNFEKAINEAIVQQLKYRIKI